MGRVARRLLRAGAVPAGVVVGLLPATAAAQTVEFTISAPAVTESSGLTRDTASGVYWTANDSGDSGIVYALAPDGSLRGTLRFRAKPIDVEAVAMAGSRLYVADIGDNTASRDFVTVYAFDFPTPRNQTVSYQAYDFTYPDGARDAEAMFVDGTGRIHLVSKEANGGIYAAPSAPSRQGTNRLQRVGNAPGYVTDGVFLPQRGAVALRTYVSVEVLSAGQFNTTARAPLPLQPQGESLALSLDGRSLLAGSEGTRSVVHRVDIPTGLRDAPTGGPTPGATATPTGNGTSTAEEEAAEGGDAGFNRTGTLRALALAGVLAVVAGAVVVLAKKP